MHLDQKFIVSALPTATFSGKEIPVNASFSIDSRTLKKGDIFIALPGTRVDGHDFISTALKAGAAGIIMNAARASLMDEINYNKQDIFIALVPNTQEALISLARTWRSHFSMPIMGITGSIGKTTTKEMIAAILTAAKMPALVSEGNQNTLIGVALNILKMRPEHRVAVFEMGINKRGEMAQIAELVRPTTAIITAIGHSHMEGLGSLQDIAAEKRDIFKYFKEDNIGIINGDQTILSTIAYHHPVIKFGCKTTNQIQARKIQVHGNSISCVIKLYHERYSIVLPTNHVGRVFNVLAAISAAHFLDIDHAIIMKTLQQPIIVAGRYELRKMRDNKGVIIHDAYNASPETMKAALLAFEKMESKGPKFAVLGDMLELGVNWSRWHQQLGRFLSKVPSLQHVILVGEHVQLTKKAIQSNVSVDIVPTWQEAIEKLHRCLEQNSIVLVKGSRGIGLNNLVDAMSENK